MGAHAEAGNTRYLPNEFVRQTIDEGVVGGDLTQIHERQNRNGDRRWGGQPPSHAGSRGSYQAHQTDSQPAASYVDGVFNVDSHLSRMTARNIADCRYTLLQLFPDEPVIRRRYALDGRTR